MVDRSIRDGRQSGQSSDARRRASVWNSRRGNHLGQRSCTTAPNRPDIWTQAIRAKKLPVNPCEAGAVHIWLVELLKRKPPKLAAVALANKIARIAWKLMTTGEIYDARRTLTATPAAA